MGNAKLTERIEELKAALAAYHEALTLSTKNQEHLAAENDRLQTDFAKLEYLNGSLSDYDHNRFAQMEAENAKLREVLRRAWEQFNELMPEPLYSQVKAALEIRTFEAKALGTEREASDG